MAKLYDSNNELIREISVEKLSNNSCKLNNCFDRFAGCVSRVELDDIEEIRENAFNNFVSITEIRIPNTVKYIGKRAFGHCVNLKKVYLSNSLETIEESAFNGCKSLESIGCDNFCENKLPESLIYLGALAFDGCKFENIYIPESVKTIGYCAFNNCSMLKKVVCLVDDKVNLLGNGNSYLLSDDNVNDFYPNDKIEFVLNENLTDEKIINNIKCLFNPIMKPKLLNTVMVDALQSEHSMSSVYKLMPSCLFKNK